MKTIEVVAAIIRKGDKLFATQRGYGEWKDFWEWPGGKVEAGETPVQALVREIHEELDAEIGIDKFLTTIDWDYPKFHLTMHCYICSLRKDALHLNEHEAARWLGAGDLRSVNWLPADDQLLPLLEKELASGDGPGIREDLRDYIEREVIPRYGAFDKAHREDHARLVIDRALAMGKAYDIDVEMLYTAAACHDLGLAVDRKTHHLESGKIIRADERLRQWFTPEQIETIAQAAEDHRASATTPPRSLYGRLVAEADRMIDPVTVIRRTVQFGFSHYPELEKEGHWQRTLEHLHEKYAEGGYLHLLIPGSPNEAPLAELRAIIHDTVRLRSIFEETWQAETRQIRPAREEDIPAILDVLEAAKGIMRASGNLDQWSDGYPSEETIRTDIGKEVGFVVVDDAVIVAYFAFIPSPEPTYSRIVDGAWLDDTLPYHVIHRIGSLPDAHGVFKSIMDWCSARDPNLRIDTHRDNRIMQHCILRYGFLYCGIIYLANGDERLAYQLVGSF